MYSTRVWKVKNISIRTIYRWKRRFLGFLTTQSGSKSTWGLWRNVQKCQHHFRWIFRTCHWRHSTPSLSMTSLSLAGVYCASTLLGRCLCKCVDVYIITISCTWRINALWALSNQVLTCFSEHFFLFFSNIFYIYVSNQHQKHAASMVIYWHIHRIYMNKLHCLTERDSRLGSHTILHYFGVWGYVWAT